jgi:hypothetical protein
MLQFYKKPFLPLIIALGKAKAKRRFSKEPIFIGGCGRSGTTILLSIISAHPEVFACPRELGLFNELIYDDQGQPGPYRIDRLYRCILTKKIKASATRFCEKSPSNVKRIETIDSYFKGNFKFIHIIRDGRDVCLSVHPTAKDRYWVEPRRWVNDVKAGLAFKKHPKVLTIHYEDLMDNYAQTIREICSFCELPLTPEMENWFEHTTVKRNRAYHQGVQKLHQGSIAKWKDPQNAKRVAEVMQYPGFEELLQELGYPD